MNKCTFCDPDPIINYKTSYKILEKKYFEAFNFYFAKPVNEILANIGSAHVILFKDYLYYDDESNEYLKRYYHLEEIKPRVKALTDFYLSSYKPTRPNLIIIDANKIINKRNQKMNKLFANKNSKEILKNNLNFPENDLRVNEELADRDNLFLDNILTSNFERDEENESNLPMCYKYQDEKKESEILPYLDHKEDKRKVSFDSSEHDIYNPKFSQNDIFLKDFENNLKPMKNDNKPMSLNKIKTRTVFKKDNNNISKQNYELLLEEIINKQKQNTMEASNPDMLLNSFKMNNNILKDFSENRISDISELYNLHEMIKNSQKISAQSSAIKQKELIKEKIDIPHIKKKENVSSQLTQESTKRTTGNTTYVSQNALKNPEKFINKKLPLSHTALFSQINKFYNNKTKTGNVDQIFELIKKMQKEEEKASKLPIDAKILNIKSSNNNNNLRNCSNKSNKDMIAAFNSGTKFLGSQTDRLPDKTYEQLFIKTKKPVNKLNLNLLKEQKNKEKNAKQRSPSTSRHSNKKAIENARKNSSKKALENQRKPTKISFRSLNSKIYSSLRNRSNISSKSHLDTQRSSDVLIFKSQDHLIPKGTALSQLKPQLENLEENESSYGFWTSRSNKINIEELKKRNKSPEIGKKPEFQQQKFSADREDYYNYGLKNEKIKAKTDRFNQDKEINQFMKLAYEKPQGMKIKSMEMNKTKKKVEKTQDLKRNFKLNLPMNIKI